LGARFSLLLGYYADMLFVNYSEAFTLAMKFLFRSVSCSKDSAQTVIAL